MIRIIFSFICVSIFNSMIWAQDKEPADLLLVHGRVYTVDSGFSTCQAFAVKDGKFIATGTTEEILGRFSSKTVIDAEERPVYPGFIDGHCHFYGYALGLQYIDLRGIRSFSEVISLLKQKEHKYPFTWIIGRGWDQNLWENKEFPDREQLDRSFPGRPVLLIRVDGHVVLASGEALKRAGITGQMNFKPGEVEIRDGRMTGILSENAADRMRNAIPVPEEKEIALLLREAQQNSFEVGLTGVCDAGLGLNVVRMIDSLQRSGGLSMKIYAMLLPSVANIRYYIQKGPYETARLTVRSVKMYADGSLGSRTALLKRPYSDDPQKTGIMVMAPDSIREICDTAKKYGYQVNIHAIGDSAVRMILDIYSGFLQGENDLRWRIEHSQVIDPADFPLYHRYSVIPSIQTTHATSDMYWAGDRLGKERLKGAYAYKTLLEQNGWLVNGTDFPIEHISPILTFYAAVTRKDLKGYPTGGFQPENALTREQALRSVTIWPARGAFWENRKGSIEPGKAADFVILDRDLMQVPEKEIPPVQVIHTYLDGVMVH
jgi:predicted amidohydrolase YtcJ